MKLSRREQKWLNHV